MSLITRLLHAVQSWRRRRGGPKTAKRATATMEYLDHRQLLSVNFTGNVPIDFPVTTSPGVVAISDQQQPGTIFQPNVKHPTIVPAIAPIVKVSGFDIAGIRVTYTPSDDILSIGLDQPPSQNHPGEVIAGDADNNGNSGTVNPVISDGQGGGIEPNFKDFPNLEGTEAMAAFLDLNLSGSPDVVAGFSGDDQRVPKPYQVANAVPSVPGAAPFFGDALLNNTGNFYLASSSQDPAFQQAHPNLEFQITNFSKIYQQETGKTLTPQSVIGIGAFGGSGNDTGISEAFFPETDFALASAIPPTPVCPPVSPPVLINPHSHRHINTAHPTDIRVNVFGTSGFDVTQIVPSTVTFGGAHPIAAFTRHINRDEWLDETFVFKGTDVKLPAGVQEAAISGLLQDGMSFSSSSQIFNRDTSFYRPGNVSLAQQRQAANPQTLATPTVTLDRKAARTPGVTVVYNSGSQSAAAASVQTQAVSNASAPVVKIHRRQPVVEGQRPSSHLSPKLQASMNRFLQTTASAPAANPAGGAF